MLKYERLRIASIDEDVAVFDFDRYIHSCIAVDDLYEIESGADEPIGFQCDTIRRS